MLLLTLVLWWAQSPMGSFDGRLRPVIAILLIAVLAFPGTAFTPECIAEERFYTDTGRSDSKTLVGNMAKNSSRLREGTLVPPTIGRIELKGRRWEFVSNITRTKPEDVVETTPVEHAWLVGFIPRSRPLTTTRPQSKRQRTLNRQRAAAQPEPAPVLTSAPASSVEKPGLALPSSIVVTENLMLQRIAEAIRANPTDDLWVVSGEITEFFEENRLIIRTAQRSNTN